MSQEAIVQARFISMLFCFIFMLLQLSNAQEQDTLLASQLGADLQTMRRDTKAILEKSLL